MGLWEAGRPTRAEKNRLPHRPGLNGVLQVAAGGGGWRGASWVAACKAPYRLEPPSTAPAAWKLSARPPTCWKMAPISQVFDCAVAVTNRILRTSLVAGATQWTVTAAPRLGMALGNLSALPSGGSLHGFPSTGDA